jgi:hypothetical protein
MNSFERILTKSADKFFLIRLYKFYIIDSILIVKRQGFKELFKQRGWKFLLIIVAYYTIRDSILYILIPYMIARGLL